MRGHGRSKVLRGAHYPMIMLAKALEGFESLGLDAAAQAVVYFILTLI